MWRGSPLMNHLQAWGSVTPRRSFIFFGSLLSSPRNHHVGPLLCLSIFSRWYPHSWAIEDSWIISHACSSIKYEYCLFNYFVSSLYLLPNSTLPNGEVQVTIWLFYKIDFSRLSNPLCQITESIGPNCQVPCCQISIPKLPIPHHEGNITKLSSPNLHFSCPQHKEIIGCLLSEFFHVYWKFHKKIRPFQNSNYLQN
jgi:hypothetical protein